MTRAWPAWIVLVASCATHTSARPFPLRDPLTMDTDTRPVSVPCRRDPSPKEPDRVTCAPVEYYSPFKWDRIDNTIFGPLSHLLAVDVPAEAANANSLDEVADSSWFENRLGAHVMTTAEETRGACRPEDGLPAEVPDGEWVIDHGKDNGSTPGFRIDVPGKGQYLLKADERVMPERASAASVIGAALYYVLGFHTSCEQIVYVQRAQFTLKPGLKVISNDGFVHPFDEAALETVLEGTAHRGKLSRMQASKWLPGLPIGPFRYEGTRDDDPNDVIPHEDRRELRGGRLLAAWLHHWDAREQNTMDMWLASDAEHKRSSPGFVRHYILDTSDVFGQHIDPYELGSRLGFSYVVDFEDILIDTATLGFLERPWDRVHVVPGREKFGLFNADEFDPEHWIGMYPNPAFKRMTERDGAWMARIIARLGEADLRAIVAAGRFSDPGDADYLAKVLLARQRTLLARYLTRLSPLTDVRVVDTAQICAVDLARLRGVLPADRFHYGAVEIGAGTRFPVPVTIGADGAVCFAPRSIAPRDRADDDPARIVIFEIENGTGAGPLQIHTYDLGDRGLRIVGLSRPAP